ncbi:MAG: hypothetical protein ACTSVL_12615 [Promethearchaeota archaeon]
MIIFIDTCFWSHSYELFKEKIFDIRKVIENYRWGLTQSVIREIKHFKLDKFVPIDHAFIVPLSKSLIDKKLSMNLTFKEFDKADQSLLIVGMQNSGIILTDDGNLLLECIAMKISAMRLPVFLLKLVEEGKVSKTIFYRCLRFWEKYGNYLKKDLKNWKKDLQQLEGLSP